MSETTDSDAESTAEGKQYGDLTLPGSQLIDRLKVLNDVMDVATFRLDNDGLHVNEANEAGIIGVNMHVRPQDQDVADVDDAKVARMSVEKLSEAVRTVGSRHDTIEFTIPSEDAEGDFYVSVGGPENHAKVEGDRDHAGTLPGFEAPDEPEGATAVVRISRFLGVVEGMAHAAGTQPVALTAHDGELVVGTGSNKNVTDAWSVPSAWVGELDHDGTVRAWFASYLLPSLFREMPAYQDITLSWEDDYPLHVEVTENFELWLSPRLFRKSEKGDDDE